MDIEGNELTDEHAKRVATGDISCTDNLPDLLKKCLPVSIAALKANWKKPIPQCWRKVWLNFPQHAKISQTNLKMPNCQIYRTLSSMPCRATSILIQLHTGHVSLNTFLKKIKALDSSPMQEMLPARDCSTLPQILQTIHRHTQQERPATLFTGCWATPRSSPLPCVIYNPLTALTSTLT